MFKDHRKKKGLTQKELAQLVGTTQQQIQRLEAGKSLPSLKLGCAIANALSCELGALFPGTFEAVDAVRQRIASQRSFTDADLDEAADAGIELDSSTWYIKALVAGRSDPLIIEVDPREARRLRRVLMADEHKGYNDFVFVSGRSELLLMNKKCIDHAEFLEENLPTNTVYIEDEEPRRLADKTNLVIEYISGAKHLVPVEHQLIFNAENEDEDNELKDVFAELEGGCIEEGQRIAFSDADDEECFLRPASIRVIHIPYGVYHHVEDEDESREDDEY